MGNIMLTSICSHFRKTENKLDGVAKASCLYHKIIVCFIIYNLVMIRVLFVSQLFYVHEFFQLYHQVDSRHLLLCHLTVHIVCLMIFLTWLWYSSYKLSKMFSHNWQELGRLSSKKVVLAMVLFKERKQRVLKTLII